jgi:hypothetical protein
MAASWKAFLATDDIASVDEVGCGTPLPGRNVAA